MKREPVMPLRDALREAIDAIEFDAIPTLLIFAPNNSGVRAVIAKLRDKVLDLDAALATPAPPPASAEQTFRREYLNDFIPEAPASAERDDGRKS